MLLRSCSRGPQLVKSTSWWSLQHFAEMVLCDGMMICCTSSDDGRHGDTCCKPHNKRDEVESEGRENAVGSTNQDYILSIGRFAQLL